MIVKDITLDPFGNLSGETFEFEGNKTNVLMGKTGAGKTTVFDAWYSALFIDSKVSRNDKEYKKYVKKRYPLDGGNMVQVSVVFEHDEDEYRLTKKWCKDKSESEAVLEGDSISRSIGDESVKKKLKELLPTNKGTFKNVLMAYQTKIQDVFSIEDDEVRSELDERLREGMAEDGITPKEFLKEVDKKLREFGGRWDFDKERPERTSTGNLYKQGTGTIYKNYKELKESKDKLDEVRSKEEKIGDKNKELNHCKKELDEVEDFLDRWEKAYNDSTEREKVEQRLENKKKERDWLVEDSESWGEAKETILTKKGELNVLPDNLDERKEEKNELEKYIQLQELTEEIDREEGKIKAGKLDGTVEAKEDVTIELQKDSGSQVDEQKLRAGDREKFEAKNRLEIRTNSLDIEVQSGEGGFDERIKKIEELESEKKEKAEEHNIQLPVNKSDPRKEKEEISGKIKDIEHRIDKAKEEKRAAEETIEKLKEKYGVSSLSELGDKKAVLKKEIEELENELDGFENIPEEFSDVSEFIDTYEESRDDKRVELMDRRSDLQEALNDIDMPDIDSKELEEEIESKEKEFQRSLDKGKAYRYLKDKTEELIEEGELIYGKLRKDIKEYFQRIYGDGFDGVKMDEMNIQSLSHPEGYDIPREYLSPGQKDITALSARLAMADYYLGDADGFLVMDDPLVNIDKEKKEKATEVIDEVAKEKQIVVMTCDRSHADMFSDAEINKV